MTCMAFKNDVICRKVVTCNKVESSIQMPCLCFDSPLVPVMLFKHNLYKKIIKHLSLFKMCCFLLFFLWYLIKLKTSVFWKSVFSSFRHSIDKNCSSRKKMDIRKIIICWTIFDMVPHLIGMLGRQVVKWSSDETRSCSQCQSTSADASCYSCIYIKLL